MQDFQILEGIGEGAFSKVFRVRRKPDDKIYALKRMRLTQLGPTERSNCLNEVRMLSRIVHPNIIQYKEAFFEGQQLCLVTELAEQGDFLQFMMRRRKQRAAFSEEELCVYAREMANGLAALHRMKIIHRDVKAANFFLGEGDRVKLGDMNVSAISRNGMASTKIGTPFYTSPEIWLELPYSTAADIWAFGCLLYEMVTFTHPFSGRDFAELKQKVLEGKYEQLRECPSGIREIIEKCLVVDPSGRLTAEEIIKNEYLKNKYNQYRQATMEKDPMKIRQRNITCAKILKEISQGSTELVRSNLPPSNYTNKKNLRNIEKRGVSLGQSFKKSKRPLSQRLITLMNIYKMKSGANNKGTLPYRLAHLR